MKVTLKQWSKWITVQEIILLIAVLIYVGCIVSGGFFASYYSMILLWIVGIATAIIAAYKQFYWLTVVNIFVPIIGFLVFNALA